MRIKQHIIFLILGLCFFPQTNHAQDEEILRTGANQDKLGNVTDEFQEYFFEALKEKAIGNHERAIDALEKCIELQPEKAILYVELGKNHKALKNYPAAEKNLKTALKMRPESPYVRIQLQELYTSIGNYQEALQVTKKLVNFDPDYYGDMANLYMMAKKPKLALKSLNMLDSLQGPSEYSNKLRRDIFKATNDLAGQIAHLKAQIAANPENQENYLRLINLYDGDQNLKLAFLWAKKLEKQHPGSEKAQLALYQLYLDKKEYEKAIASIKKVLSGKELKTATKMKVLKDFVSFVKKHPTYENVLTNVLNIAIKTGENLASNKELGDFYSNRDKTKALEYYTAALKDNFNDVGTIENTVVLQLDLKQYEDAAALSKKALVVFPSRPKLYLLRGTALNKLKKYPDALESLEFGLGYLIGNPDMAVGMYQQMAIAHRGLGQEKKAVLYEKKVAEMKDQFINKM